MPSKITKGRESKNGRNVAALAAVLRQCPGFIHVTGGPARIERIEVDTLASELAARGVLAAEAMTDQEATAAIEAATSLADGWESDATLLRQELDRIAKGER
jgi:hypothetical protein